jgi:hypothetical protein
MAARRPWEERAVLAVLIAVAIIGQANAAPDACWTKLPSRPQFTAADQVRNLQAHIKSAACDVVGLAWTTSPTQQGLLLWEAKPQTLWRLTMDGPAARWEKWAGASRARLLADNPADGFTLGVYTQGKGRAEISPSAGGFVKQHAPGTFDAALPVNCDTPAPAAPAAAGSPPFLTKCG